MSRNCSRTTRMLISLCLWCCAFPYQPARADDDAPVRHVLLISIDGLHSQDLAMWIAANPNSTLAGLAAHGVNYPNAFTTQPSDSIPATVGIFTGASPALGGMYYDDAWSRAWSPKGSNCAIIGTAIDLKEGVDIDPHALDGGGGIDPNNFPLNPNNACIPFNL